jgi:uncharacterized membrane protein YsdA (DUF1294 family)
MERYTLPLSLISAFILTFLVSLSSVLPLYWIWLAITSVVTFFMYGLDKNLARSGARRVPESTLHGLALVGGFAGGWAGRVLFRHKTRKPEFLVILSLSTGIHFFLIYFFFLPR